MISINGTRCEGGWEWQCACQCVMDNARMYTHTRSHSHPVIPIKRRPSSQNASNPYPLANSLQTNTHTQPSRRRLVF